MNRSMIVAGSLALAVACSKSAQSANNASASRLLATPGPSPAGEIRPVSISGSGPAVTIPAAVPAEAPNDIVENASAGAATYREVTLPAGTILPVDLRTAVGSDTSRVEQAVQGRLRRAVHAHGVEVLPAGATISGHVTAAERPGKVKGRGRIALRFTQVDTPGEGRSAISTATISRLAPATKEKDALTIVAPATAGAVIGRIAGGKSGAAKGAVIGGGAGTGYVLGTRGKDVRMAPGTDLAVKLTAPLKVRLRISK